MKNECIRMNVEKKKNCQLWTIKYFTLQSIDPRVHLLIELRFTKE